MIRNGNSRLALAAFAAALLAGCGGGGGARFAPSATNVAPANPNVGGGTKTASTARVGVTVDIPARGVGGGPATVGRSPLYLPTGANVACVTVQNQDPVTQSQVSSPYNGSSYVSCVTYTGAATNVVVPAPPGNDTFTIGLYFATAAQLTGANALPFNGSAVPTVWTALASTTVPQNNSLTITPAVTASASAQNVALSATTGLVQGSRIIVDQGLPTVETVSIIAVGPTAPAPAGSINAIFAQGHNAGAKLLPVVNVTAGQVQATTGATTVSLNGLLNPGSPTAPITLTGVISSPSPVLVTPSPAASPIPFSNRPVREQGNFLTTATNRVFVPIPVGIADVSGALISGIIQASAGVNTFTSGTLVTASPATNFTVTVSRTESPAAVGTGHTQLYVLDAFNGAIAQVGSGATQSVTLTQLGGLNATDIKVAGSAAAVFDPYVVVLAYDGTGSEVFSNATVTESINGLGSTTQTITPQAMIYTAGAAAPNYVDTAPYSATALGALYVSGTAAQTGLYVTDGVNVRKSGTAGPSTASAGAPTKLGALTWDSNANVLQLYSADIGFAGGGAATTAPQNSGLWATPIGAGGFVAGANTAPLAVQVGTANYVQFTNPSGVGYATNENVLYVMSGTTLYRVDPLGITGALIASGGFQLASGSIINYASAASGAPGAVGNSVSATVAQFKPTAGAMSAMIPDGTGKLYIADTGNNAIRLFDPGARTVTTTAIGQPWTGLTLDTNGTKSFLYATDTTGKVWIVDPASGASSNLNLAAAAGATGVDGFVGTFATQTTTIPAAAPQPYSGQGNTANFFGTGPVKNAPYNLPPFCNNSAAAAGDPALPASTNQLCTANVTTTAFTLATGGPPTFATDTGFAAAVSLGAATIKAPTGITYIPGTQAATATLTPNSFVIVDNGVRTFVP